MNKINDNKLIPKLRFLGFSKYWIVTPVSEFCRVYRGSPLSKADLDNNGSEPCIHYGELFTKYSEVISSIYSKTNRVNGFKSEVGDVLMPSSDVTPDGLAKASALMLNNINLGGDMNILRIIKDINPIFLSYLLNRSKKEIIKLVSGTTIKHIYPSQISTCFLPIVYNISEQQKIASCLSSLDEIITAENKKLDLLKEHKKGLLQNLFPQEGETIPKLRFKEFEKSGEWELKLIEDFFDVGSSKRVLQQDWTSQGIPFYRTRELVSLSKNEPFGSEVFISEELYNILKNTYGVPKDGDFLVSGVGTLGICYQVKPNDRFYFKDGNVIWFKLEGNINSMYFKYCFQADHIQNQIVGQTSKSTVGTYTIQNAKKTKFWFAPTTKEQEKIADILTSLDDLINAQSQKLETLKLHKKGLLQGLFPTISNEE